MHSISAPSAARLLSRLTLAAVFGSLLIPCVSQAQVGLFGWSGFGNAPQHTNLSTVRAQPMRVVRWSTPVDLNPQYAGGGNLYSHYGSPVITKNNTVVLPVKTGAGDGWQVEAHKGTTGTLLWTQTTGYSLPPYGWTPCFGLTLTPDNRVALPESGGRVVFRSAPDTAAGTTTTVTFYGDSNYASDPATCNSNIKISTPITSDSKGNLYFGFVILGANPANLQSGLARISAAGVGTWVPASTMTSDATMQKVIYNCAPVLSGDEKMVYVAINNLNGSVSARAISSRSTAPTSRRNTPCA